MFCNAEQILSEGVNEKAFPSAAYAVGCKNEVFLKGVLGNRQELPTKIKADIDTLYDMASLTKVVCTTMIALKFIESGKLLLTDTLDKYYDMTDAPDGRAGVTVKQLMTHTSGITPHIALSKYAADPRGKNEVIIKSEPVCRPGEQVYYSCMGYMLLADILEKISDKSLDELACEYVFVPLKMERSGFNPNEENVAATEFSSVRNTYIKGKVHDENAYFLGGVSGNAGLFSCVSDMINYARMISCRGVFEGKQYISSRMFDIAVHNFTSGKAEARGLGFQLCAEDITFPGGDLFSVGSYGHTGFTGTSVFADNETGLWILLLTNAVHYGRDKTKYFCYRRKFHNAVVSEFFKKHY